MESLVSMSEKIMPNSFVLEAPEPFPGYFQYYHERPENNTPLYVYLVLAKHYRLEEVTRATQNILRYFPIKFDAALGSILLHNELWTVIRLRHFESYDFITDLQVSYADEGIDMHKALKKNIKEEGLIRLKKFFSLEQKNELISFDLNEPDHAYIHVPKKLTWKNFEHTTMLVKNNWDKTIFDAAMGYFYINFAVQDMIRIYDPNLNLEDIEGIAKLYLNRMK